MFKFVINNFYIYSPEEQIFSLGVNGDGYKK